MSTELTVIGAGGHASVVLDAAFVAGLTVVRVRDDNSARTGEFLEGVPIASLAEWFDGNYHVAIGDNLTRRNLSARLQAPGRLFTGVVHPAAILARSARIGPGVFVAARAIISASASVGAGAIVNHGAIVDHDVLVGAWSHVAPGVILGGAVRVGEGCLIGAGAILLPGIEVGPWCIVGAGAVVNKNVPDGRRIYGVPASDRGDNVRRPHD